MSSTAVETVQLLVFDAKEADRIRLEPTFVHPKGNAWSWENTKDAVQLEWSDQLEKIVVTNLPTTIVGTGLLSKWAITLSMVFEYAEEQSVLARRAYYHPGKKGLVPKTLVSTQRKNVSQKVFKILQDNNPVAPLWEFDIGQGWFAPEADPLQFGTLFIAPHDLIRFDGHEWALWMVGRVDEPVNVYKWDDEKGLNTAAENVLSGDGDTLLTMFALTDLVQIQKEAKLQAVREAVIKGREAYKVSGRNSLVRPQLCEKALTSTYSQTPEKWRTVIENSMYMVVQRWTLENTEVFNFQYPAPIDGMGKINVTVGGVFRQRRVRSHRGSAEPVPMPAVNEFDVYAQQLGKTVGERNLGIIVRAVFQNDVSTTGVENVMFNVVFYVVRNVEMFAKFRAAFGMPVDTELNVLNVVDNTAHWTLVP